MKDRIKKIQLHFGLTQQAFADKIGISRVGYQKIINGVNRPSEGTLRTICYEYGVNRLWLDTGQGKMLIQPETDKQMIDEWLDESDAWQRAVILSIVKTPGGWEKLRQIVDNLNLMLKKPPD